MITQFSLPFPVSVNAMFITGKYRRARSQRYEDWIQIASHSLKMQKPTPVLGPVKITYEFEDGRDNRRRDAFNLEKGVTDLLVNFGIIEADHDKILREGRVLWARGIEGVRITIESLGAGNEARDHNGIVGSSAAHTIVDGNQVGVGTYCDRSSEENRDKAREFRQD